MYNAKKQLQNGRNFLSTIHLKGSYYLQSIRNWKKNRHQNFWLSIFSIWTNGSNIQFLKEDTQESGEMARCVKALVQTWKPGLGLSTHRKQTGKHKHVYVNGCACVDSLVLWEWNRRITGACWLTAFSSSSERICLKRIWKTLMDRPRYPISPGCIPFPTPPGFHTNKHNLKK